eukprot:354567-Chlamydomonas_euryale.AAC.7
MGQLSPTLAYPRTRVRPCSKADAALKPLQLRKGWVASFRKMCEGQASRDQATSQESCNVCELSQFPIDRLAAPSRGGNAERSRGGDVAGCPTPREFAGLGQAALAALERQDDGGLLKKQRCHRGQSRLRFYNAGANEANSYEFQDARRPGLKACTRRAAGPRIAQEDAAPSAAAAPIAPTEASLGAAKNACAAWQALGRLPRARAGFGQQASDVCADKAALSSVSASNSRHRPLSALLGSDPTASGSLPGLAALGGLWPCLAARGGASQRPVALGRVRGRQSRLRRTSADGNAEAGAGADASASVGAAATEGQSGTL